MLYFDFWNFSFSVFFRSSIGFRVFNKKTLTDLRNFHFILFVFRTNYGKYSLGLAAKIMKKNFFPVFLAFLLFTASLALVLNISVTTKRGSNYIVTKIELPLYLKLLNFFDRHFNYKLLVKQIIGHLKTPEEKVFRLF